MLETITNPFNDNVEQHRLDPHKQQDQEHQLHSAEAPLSVPSSREARDSSWLRTAGNVDFE